MSSRPVTLAILAIIFGFSGCKRDETPLSPGAKQQPGVLQSSIVGSFNTIWTEGAQYRRVNPSQPASADKKTVEVIEFFEYGCGHCYVLEPWLLSWERNKPEYIKFTRIPVTYNATYLSHAHLFYTLQSLGRIGDRDATDLHHEVFDTIHRLGNPLLVIENAEKSKALQLGFSQRFGIADREFERAYESPEVASALQRAAAVNNGYRIQETPTLVIGGKYVTNPALAGGDDLLIILIGDLANHIRAETEGQGAQGVRH